MKLVRNFLAEKIFDEYDENIAEREAEFKVLENRITKIVSALKIARSDNNDLLTLIKALTETLVELNEKTQQHLQTPKKAQITL